MRSIVREYGMTRLANRLDLTFDEVLTRSGSDRMCRVAIDTARGRRRETLPTGQELVKVVLEIGVPQDIGVALETRVVT